MVEVIALFLAALAVIACGTYCFGRALPRVGAVLAVVGVAAAAIGASLVLGEPGGGPGFAMAIAIVGVLAGAVVFAAVGLLAGALFMPGLIAGPWAGLLCMAVLAAWPAARAARGLGAVAFIACCTAGAAWRSIRSRLDC